MEGDSIWKMEALKYSQRAIIKTKNTNNLKEPGS